MSDHVFVRQKTWTCNKTSSDGVELAAADLQSDLIDLSGYSLKDLRYLHRNHLASALDRLLAQVFRPRGNFGGGDPPDRVD
jgi:hypothetical protein